MINYFRLNYLVMVFYLILEITEIIYYFLIHEEYFLIYITLINKYQKNL